VTNVKLDHSRFTKRSEKKVVFLSVEIFAFTYCREMLPMFAREEEEEED